MQRLFASRTKPRWIDLIDRVIGTISEHIVGYRSRIAGQSSISIEESSPSWVVEAGLEVIKAGLFVVLVAPVAEGIFSRRN